MIDIITPGLFLCAMNHTNILLKKSFTCFGNRKPNGEMRPVICKHYHVVQQVYFDMFQIPHVSFVPDYSKPIPHIKVSILKNIYEIYLS